MVLDHFLSNVLLCPTGRQQATHDMTYQGIDWHSEMAKETQKGADDAIQVSEAQGSVMTEQKHKDDVTPTLHSLSII